MDRSPNALQNLASASERARAAATAAGESANDADRRGHRTEASALLAASLALSEAAGVLSVREERPASDLRSFQGDPRCTCPGTNGLTTQRRDPECPMHGDKKKGATVV